MDPALFDGILLFQIGFLEVSFWDVLDVSIVAYLMYRIYMLLKGSIAFNIFIGVLILYLVYGLVDALKMEMLSVILGEFVSVGFIIIIIIFQPEVRRFLLLLGNTTLQGRTNFLRRWLDKSLGNSEERQAHVVEIKSALLRMSKEKTGALLVFAKSLTLQNISNTYVEVDARITAGLLESIFNKESPLHDGAVVLGKGRILAAGCILPVSESMQLPPSAGLRHRAAVGISERTIAVAFVVSEETGAISFAAQGKIEMALSESRLTELINQHYEV
ncbi:MAG: diadenylate cyclase CdaA [Saprospiraceae bacterium]